LLVRTQRMAHLLDQPGTLFAMKVIKKKHIRQEDQVASVNSWYLLPLLTSFPLARMKSH